MNQRPTFEVVWRAYGEQRGWPIRPAGWWLRLPIIRVIRSYRYMYAVSTREEMFGRYSGGQVPRDVWTFHGVIYGFL